MCSSKHVRRWLYGPGLCRSRRESVKFRICSIALCCYYFPINVWFSASEQARRGRGENNNNHCTICPLPRSDLIQSVRRDKSKLMGSRKSSYKEGPWWEVALSKFIQISPQNRKYYFLFIISDSDMNLNEIWGKYYYINKLRIGFYYSITITIIANKICFTASKPLLQFIRDIPVDILP